MPTPARIDGIDLSHWQAGALDFATAKRAGVRFVIHKATEGTGYTDPGYAQRRAEVAAAGIVFGAYHFAKPTGTPEAQARHFLSVARPVKGDMRPALDFEDPGFEGWSVARKTAWVKAFVDVIEQATGAKPIVYLPGTWALSSTLDCPLWTPRYSDAMSAPHVPAPWRTHTIWQFSNGVIGSPSAVPGIGACDINTINSHDPARVVEALRLGHTDPAPQPAKPAGPTRIVHAREQIHVGINALEQAVALCIASKRPRALLAAPVLKQAVRLLQRALSVLPPA